mgnify:CR=1 FL=1
MLAKNYAEIGDYELFSEFLLENRAYLDPKLDFITICRDLNIDYKSLDNTLFHELGVGGQELIEIFRDGEMKRLLHLHH